MSEMYLIWSNEHKAWWNPNESGYTRSSAAAGRYSREAVLKICFANFGWPKFDNPDEVPLREADVLEIENAKNQTA